MRRRAATRPRRILHRPRAWPVLLLLVCPLALAAVTPPLSEAGPTGSAAGAVDSPRSPQADPVGEYLDAIERAELQGGAWSTELIDLYYGMGQALLDQGDLEWARDAFYQTVTVSRVNTGPHGLEQTRYLYSVADVESRIGNRPGAVEVLDNIYRIHARHHGEDNPDLLPEVLKIAGWYRERLMGDGLTVRPSDFQNLSYLVGRIAALTETRYGLADPRTAYRYRELGQVHYQAVRYFVETGLPPNPELVMQSEGSSNVALLEQATINHLEAGEEAFSRAAQAWMDYPGATDLQRAEAMAELGDWYLVFRYFRKARKQYEAAYDLLARSTEFGALADRYLGVPSPLRFLDPPERFGREPEPPPTDGLLEVSFTVSLTGRLYNIEILRAPESLTPDDLRILKDHLSSTRFRPAVVNGRSQSVEDYVWKALSPGAAALPVSG